MIDYIQINILRSIFSFSTQLFIMCMSFICVFKRQRIDVLPVRSSAALYSVLSCLYKKEGDVKVALEF